MFTKSEEWVRESATISERPALASQADSVRRTRFFDSRKWDLAFRDHRINPRNNDISSSSRHRRMDRKWSRFTRIPSMPR